jgi:predicted amidohydrolase YtcJ
MLSIVWSLLLPMAEITPPPPLVLRAGTLLGTVEKGKVADLVAVAGDPLKDVRLLERPVLVVQAGRIVFSSP